MTLIRVARLLVALVLAAGGVCRADQVVLDNGDRISGTVKRVSDGKLVIETEYAGDVSVDLKRITSLQTDSEMTVVLEDDTRLYGPLSGSPQHLEVSGAAEPVDLTQASKVESGHVTGQVVTVAGGMEGRLLHE